MKVRTEKFNFVVSKGKKRITFVMPKKATVKIKKTFGKSWKEVLSLKVSSSSGGTVIANVKNLDRVWHEICRHVYVSKKGDTVNVELACRNKTILTLEGTCKRRRMVGENISIQSMPAGAA